MSRRMNEKIVVISHDQNTRGYLSVVGFEVVTNKQRTDCLEYYTFAQNAEQAIAKADTRRKQMIAKGEWET